MFSVIGVDTQTFLGHTATLKAELLLLVVLKALHTYGKAAQVI